MPTRYTLDVDLKDVVSVDALQSKDKKVSACKATKEKFEERFKTGKNRRDLEVDNTRHLCMDIHVSYLVVPGCDDEEQAAAMLVMATGPDEALLTTMSQLSSENKTV
ncbi:Ribosomal protein L27e [Corchorus capsularis]|uniref:Ribosomal protein L27e n=1 Tax=Corchorus capsularis TaxID=210143 RepID=A0A1R3GGA2_COCAP|nr:Ribosomal protein L27e [Corchorus capsularis]